jgi:D-alanine-D-alanine ligase
MSKNTQIPLVIICGGKSSEHEISLLSAGSVLRNADPKRYQIELIAIDQDGNWFYQPSSEVKKVLKGKAISIQKNYPVGALPLQGLFYIDQQGDRQPIPAQVVFPVLHGTNGEDGTIQGFLDMVRLPYVGSGVLGSSLGMDKEKMKQVWEQAGLPVVPYKTYMLLKSDELPSQSKIEDMWRHWTNQLGTPVFIKPARAGSSIGISRAHEYKEFQQGFYKALEYDSKILIESSVNAREIECSVIGNTLPRAFVPGEVKTSHSFYDYEAKYMDPNGAELFIPASLPQEVVLRIKDLAVRAFRACEARGLARVDFFYDEEHDKIYLNEINTMPGFTQISMFSKMCEAGGLGYKDIIDELVELALEESNRKTQLSYKH